MEHWELLSCSLKKEKKRRILSEKGTGCSEFEGVQWDMLETIRAN